MKLATRIAPPNSLLLVMDRDTRDLPKSMDGMHIKSTPSCIAVGTLHQLDGETTITLTDETPLDHDIDGLHMVFSGLLEVPSGEVDVYTVLNEAVLQMPVSTRRVGIAVFADDDFEPQQLYIFIDGED
jgi:hypothetical protein